MKHSDVYALILMGGQSVRFGSPKGLQAIQGIPQWARVQELLIPNCEKVFFSLTKATRGLYKDVLEESIIYDKNSIKGLTGPMAAMLAALEYSEQVSWLIVSVDLFFLDTEGIELLLRNRDGKAGVVTYYHQVIQPLCALYEKSSYLAIKQSIAANRFGLRALIPELSPLLIDGSKLTGVPHPLTSINTVDELLKYQENLTL